MKDNKLFIGGLLNSNFFEAYYVIDLEKRETKEIIIDNTVEQKKLLELIKKQFSNSGLPYGAKNEMQFLPYLINPHSCYRIGNKMLSFMLQAPYFREINLNTYENCTVMCDGRYDLTFSASSIGIAEPDSIYVSVNSSNERAGIYNGMQNEMGFRYYLYNAKDRLLRQCANVCHGLIDNMHQVGYSKDGFLVSLDMNISVEIDGELTNLQEKAARTQYRNACFKKGKMFVWDLNKEKAIMLDPPLHTPAHVEFDANDQSIFYVSCHNMSKLGNSMVLHGPGMIVKYQYKNGRIRELGSYSEEDFNRITTHKIFYYEEKSFLAVSGYPNYLYILDGATMELVKKIKLFEAEYPVVFQEGLFQCIGNRNAPLYLQVNEEGTKVYLVNSDTCFEVSWLDGKVDNFKYTENDFGVSTHIEIF